MKSNIFIPKKINVGFQNRSDTYTKKLAYVIYYDEKGKLRKEASWNSWRDKKINPIEFNNEPTSGFVLNKKVGDYVSDWNHRQAYVRIYDPRDFEFEITVENLLYILENTSSIKGKGLEGEFIYGWDGKELVLIPISSPDYIEISKYNSLVHNKNHIKAKDLKLGATYRTKQNEEWIYMGRFDYWKVEYDKIPKDSRSYSRWQEYDTIRKDINKGKYYYFIRKYKYSWSEEINISIEAIKSLGDKFIDKLSEECVEDYADLFDKLEHSTMYSPYDESKDEYVQYSFEEFCEKLKNRTYIYIYRYLGKEKICIYKERDSDTKCHYEIKDPNSTGYYEKYLRIEGTFEEIYNNVTPMYKKEYLQNGKLYREVKN